MAYQGNQQVIVLKEDTKRSRGRDARRSNMMAGQIIAEVLKTTLGPRGMDKMLVDGLGDITITSDGAKVLRRSTSAPSGQDDNRIAKTQDEVGDGMTTSVVFAGELLKKAGSSDRNSSSIVISGYQKAADKAPGPEQRRHG
jgi:chaperonin GroEL (HSP60 family)